MSFLPGRLTARSAEDADNSECDEKYIDMQAKAHEEAVGLFEDFSENDDAEMCRPDGWSYTSPR